MRPHTRPARTRRPPRWLPLVVHLGITLIVILVGSRLLPRWYIHHQIENLTADATAHREQALNYVVHRAATDPRVLQGAIDQLAVEDPTNFLQIANALDRAGQWRRPMIPDQPWLRWLNALGADPAPQARINAAMRLAQLTDLADHRDVLAMLKRWLADPDPDVRHQTLTTLTHLVGRATDRSPYESFLTHAADDPSPTTAHDAWILRGLLRSATTLNADWHNQPPQIAHAMLWATASSHAPALPEAVIQAIEGLHPDPAVQAMAAYCLHLSTTDQARQTLTQLFQSIAPTVGEPQQVFLWRTVLSMTKPGDAADAQPTPPPAHWTTQQLVDWLDDPVTQPATLSALYRGLAPRDGVLQQLTDQPGCDALKRPLALLAVLEGLTVDQAAIPIPPDMPDMLRLATVAVTQNPQPNDLAPLFRSDEATMRDLACVVAMDRFTPHQLSDIVESLLKDFSDNAKRSGAILAGLTGTQPQLLAKAQNLEDTWSVQQIHQLGMWMQGQRPEMDQVVPGLLSRDDLPTSTILLALLHRDHPAAWDYLLGPRGLADEDLIDLFDQLRWWRIVQRYLPNNAPPFWVWADPQLEQFQIDVLRQWHLLHHHYQQPSYPDPPRP